MRAYKKNIEIRQLKVLLQKQDHVTGDQLGKGGILKNPPTLWKAESLKLIRL